MTYSAFDEFFSVKSGTTARYLRQNFRIADILMRSPSPEALLNHIVEQRYPFQPSIKESKTLVWRFSEAFNIVSSTNRLSQQMTKKKVFDGIYLNPPNAPRHPDPAMRMGTQPK